MFISPNEISLLCHVCSEKQNLSVISMGVLETHSLQFLCLWAFQPLCLCLERPSLPPPPHHLGNSGLCFNCPVVHLSVPRHPPTASIPSRLQASQEQRQNPVQFSAQQPHFQQKVLNKEKSLEPSGGGCGRRP